jgi:D-alanine-D-alanine ligase
MKIGIFFGGPAREREISFAGGKTAIENIDKTLFTPVPVFVDSLGHFILIHEQLMYQNAIRDFYPPASYQPKGYSVYIESLDLNSAAQNQVISEIGRKIEPAEFKALFDFAFIAMHGPGAEDGSIQGLLEWYGLPYSGPGILGSGVGIDKIAQNDMLELAVGLDKQTHVIQKEAWQTENHGLIFEATKTKLGLPFVVKAPHQGSSIGVAFVKTDSLAEFEAALGQCFFIKNLESSYWQGLDTNGKRNFIQNIINLDTGIGLPLMLAGAIQKGPEQLLNALDTLSDQHAQLTLESLHAEDAVLCESFVHGQEFSCGVIQDPSGRVVALPPTEIVKAEAFFDFNSKYKPGATRKRIPVGTSLENNQNIQKAVARAFSKLGFQVCTRIDGFLKANGSIVLHDPNTIPGMSPTSLIFKQLAEIGLNVTEAITYFIRQSIRERMRAGKNSSTLAQMLAQLDQQIKERALRQATLPVYSIEISGSNAMALDLSYAAARKQYGHIAAEGKFKPEVVLVHDGQKNILAKNLLFKDYIEDLLAAVASPTDPLITETRANAQDITALFGAI